jgi:hypothetical protein
MKVKMPNETQGERQKSRISPKEKPKGERKAKIKVKKNRGKMR